MGVTGTDVTKEASSVILMDDNFATLVSAVEEGRVIYRNIRKFIRYLFSCNIGEVVTMFFAMLMGMPVPLLPIQILLVNLATDGLPAIALGLEPPDKDVMREKPRRADESVFSNGLGFTIVIRGLLIGICTLGVFTSLIRSCGDLHTARTGALLALVMMQLIHVFECKSETKSIFAINPFNNLKLVGAVLSSAVIMYFAIYNPLLAPMFRAVPLTLSQLVTVASYCVFVPIVSGVILGVKNRTARHTVATVSELGLRAVTPQKAPGRPADGGGLSIPYFSRSGVCARQASTSSIVGSAGIAPGGWSSSNPPRCRRRGRPPAPHG